ncbi:ComEA family DNA-binding protein [Aquabacterium sp. OR-4]|uniref:ComEA family DNA-binding protein n=1 Tax=Aquabacterium sp. OR-4 TaxID=2978127 RepID=UPI0021B33165|nr:helix-hairpin-helix domain-containing protein [Aquabacterium sp. OR-4]MDT7837107.1 helix-hairpin-helix domain-containing protein [Aquabacterium sp. OR-4]
MSIHQHIARLLLAAVTALTTLATPALAEVEANRASQAELETVKGIGPALSGKILAARERGAFKDWTDLQERVAGIGSGNSARFSQAGLTVAGSGFAGLAEAAPRAGTATAPRGAGGKTDKTGKADKADKADKARKGEAATRP